MGQIVALILLRKFAPQMQRPYRVWLYPLPCLIALAGWGFIFATTPHMLKGDGIAFAAGVLFYVFGARLRARLSRPHRRRPARELTDGAVTLNVD